MSQTLEWMAPEVMFGGIYTLECDVFSTAVVVWECISQRMPYSGTSLSPTAHGGLPAEEEEMVAAIGVDGLRLLTDPHTGPTFVRAWCFVN